MTREKALPGQFHQQDYHDQDVGADQHEEQRSHVLHSHGDDEVLGHAVQLHVHPVAALLPVDTSFQDPKESKIIHTILIHLRCF